jgi:hypothetical protein
MGWALLQCLMVSQSLVIFYTDGHRYLRIKRSTYIVSKMRNVGADFMSARGRG